MPDCLACYCPRLIKLDLSQNELNSLRSVECLPPTLKHLNLQNNRLQAMFRRPDTLALHCYAPSPADSTAASGRAAAGTSVNRHSSKFFSTLKSGSRLQVMR